MNNAVSGAKVLATFDAVYCVTQMSDASDTRPFNHRLESGSINDIEVVASVIKGALGLERPRA